ncbi:MAG: lytic murein transglycosylase B [Gammaproteobacteria bacterium]|nr:lytic murein transglycosylase B [Gammaproteobacteria bacterium]NNF60765.1 lytic murein transglycosylase B [Gammaproteobacteria bacterium]NNM20224.1 lytic murein transglycosylase B [Gammaproteobacteria bacterium]
MKTALCCLAFMLLPAASVAFDTPQIDSFVTTVADRHDLDAGWVRDIVSAAQRKQSILDAISRPAEKAKPWHEYRRLFINERRISDGVAFWREHREILEQVAADCGVPAGVIVAILGIETHYGNRSGGYRVLDALATLAFAYPPRSEFFRSELEQFLLLTREHAIDPLQAQGSYAGAMGAPQFISSSYRRYAVDGSGDGRVDLWQDWRDVIGSVANYLHEFGWRRNEPVAEQVAAGEAEAAQFLGDKIELIHRAGDLRAADIPLRYAINDDMPVLMFELEQENGRERWVGYNNFYVITRYNRSTMYAMAVRDLSTEISMRVNTQ